VGLTAAGIRGFIDALSDISIGFLSFSFSSSCSFAVIFKDFEMLIFILEGAEGIVDVAESSSTLPSIVLFTATCVVSTAAASAMLSSSSKSNKCNKYLDFV
jgi:hypothetical protein